MAPVEYLARGMRLSRNHERAGEGGESFLHQAQGSGRSATARGGAPKHARRLPLGQRPTRLGSAVRMPGEVKEGETPARQVMNSHWVLSLGHKLQGGGSGVGAVAKKKHWPGGSDDESEGARGTCELVSGAADQAKLEH